MNNYRERIKKLSPRQQEWLAQQLLAVNPQQGEADRQLRLVAFVQGSDLDIDALRSHLKERLPDYMVPSAIVQLTKLPLLPNGKVDLQALPDPGEVLQADDSAYAKAGNPVQQKLVGIWENVLQFQPIGIQDNFFEIGGDSILSIQIIARARKEGIVLKPTDIFEHQTIAELALVAQTGQEPATKPVAVSGTVPLSPIQHWFFDEHHTAPHYWNQVLFFALPETTAATTVEQALRYLISHHDALRLKFKKGNGMWKANLPEPERTNPFRSEDLSGLSKAAQDTRMKELTASLQDGFNLAEGPLFLGIFFTCYPVQPNHLFLVAHHLLVDAVSWQILVEDLNTLSLHIQQGQEPSLPVKATSFKAWSEHLHAEADKGTYRREFDFWKAQVQLPNPFPKDFEAALPVAESGIDFFHFSLDGPSTRSFLSDAANAYHTRAEELVITALVQTLAEWTAQPEVCIGIERHGRESFTTDMDLSSTVGWFTAYFPVLLRLEKEATVGEKIKSIKEQLRKIPRGGMGYGILRYLDHELPGRDELIYRPQVIFNYLGTQDPIRYEVLGTPRHVLENTRHAESERYQLLEINAYVSEGQLRVNWAYNRDVYRRSTLEKLAGDVEQMLHHIINHCTQPETGGHTPSDFPEAGLSQDDLDRLLGNIDAE